MPSKDPESNRKNPQSGRVWILAAVLVAGTAVLLALNSIGSPFSLEHGPGLRPSGEHQPCDRAFFVGVLPQGATVENVTVVRDGDSYGEGEANVAYPKNPTHLPPLCAVTVRVTSSPTSSYRLGLFLPESWNSRLLVVGNGGFAGGINWLDMAAGARYGMASLSTDTGHSSKSTNSTWAYNQPEKKADWGWRAIHGSTVLGKKLVRKYYAQQRLTYSYFSGCSTGGRQGLKELQTFPDSFDGALIGAAAWWTSHLNTYVTQAGLYNLPETDPKHLTDDHVSLLADEVTRQCDTLDGVEDGIISSPELCQPNLETLLCPNPSAKRTDSDPDPDAPTCLTRAQLTTAHNMYSDYRSITTNEFLHPGLTPGSEPQWHVLINGSEPSPYGVGYASNFLFDGNAMGADPATNTSWDWRTFNESVVQYAARHDPGRATADDYAALTAVRRRGGKVLMYHGTGDGLVPTKGTELYYRRTVEALGAARRGWWWWWWWGPFFERLGWGRGRGAGHDGGVDDFFRMFLVPGMQHCAGTAVDAPWSFGAPSQAGALGNDTWSVPGFEDAQHDALLALVDWVEKGRPVESVVATTWEDPVNSTSGVKRQRPLCAWPRRAVWDEKGDVDDAGSWWCSH